MSNIYQSAKHCEFRAMKYTSNNRGKLIAIVPNSTSVITDEDGTPYKTLYIYGQWQGNNIIVRPDEWLVWVPDRLFFTVPDAIFRSTFEYHGTVDE